MERNWYLLCIIALASAALLFLTMVNMVAVIGAYFAGLTHANQQRINMGTTGFAILVTIFGPMILAKKYSVGLRWGMIGILLCFAAYAAAVLPAFLASLEVYWALLGATAYLVFFGILYLKRRRRLAAMQQRSDLVKRFD